MSQTPFPPRASDDTGRLARERWRGLNLHVGVVQAQRAALRRFVGVAPGAAARISIEVRAAKHHLRDSPCAGTVIIRFVV